MTKSPPSQPGADSADDAARSVQAQLDQLLAQIETEEPGTVDAEALPAGFEPPHAAKPAGDPAPSSPAEATNNNLAQAMESFEQALDTADASADPPAEPEPTAADNDGEADMLAELNSALQDLNPGKTDEPEPEPEPESAENNAETDMLAALNAALEDLKPSGSAAPTSSEDDESEANPEPGPEPAPEPAKPFEESSLQDEISALLNAPPQTEAQAQSPAPEAERAADAEDRSSTEDQIAAEIETLLDDEAPPPTRNETNAEAPAQTPPESPADADGSIDGLDQLLAEEIDEDEELAGDFQSVQDITAGIDTGQDEQLVQDDHAATARDVADELDNQPEDQAPGDASKADHDAAQDNDEQDSDAILDKIAEAAQKNADAPNREQARQRRRDLINRAKETALQACFLLNWPARRFLTHEWRANLGYVALLNLFFGVALWLYLIFR
jgi:hypothetical protein